MVKICKNIINIVLYFKKFTVLHNDMVLLILVVVTIKPNKILTEAYYHYLCPQNIQHIDAEHCSLEIPKLKLHLQLKKSTC